MATAAGETESSAKELRWGILACGKISNDFVLAMRYTRHPHRVVAVATSNSVDRANQFCEKIGGMEKVKRYGSYQQLLDDGEVDVVYVGNWNADHHKWTIAALNSGKHVLCEKPMGVNSREVREMIEAAQRNKRFLMEAFWSRYFPVYRHILKVIQSGEWGEPQVVHANFGIPLDETRHLPGDCETPLVDIGLYTVQFALFVFGDAKLEKITAEGKVDADGCDRWANITLRFAGGKHAVLYYNGDQFVPNSAWVAFRNGKQLVLPEFFWCPTQLLKVTDVTKKTPPEVVNEPLNEEADLSKFFFNHSSGLRYETDCVYDCIQAGRIECGNMPHAESVRIAGVLEEIRRQLGVVFKQDAAT